MGASSYEDRATAAEPVVSALRGGIPSAGEIEREIIAMWLWLGRTVQSCVTQGSDWICEDPKSTRMAVEWLDIAESCLTRAAQAMSAGTAETPTEAQGDSPPARSEGCAQTQEPNP